MTKTGILSDTHGELLPQVTEFLSPCQILLHAGDIGNIETFDRLRAFKPLQAVYGNIDDYKVRLACPQLLRCKIEDCRILMTHIGGWPGHYASGIGTLLKAERPDLFISGHSHILKIMPDTGLNLLHINPGAAGRKGFHSHITAVRLDIDGKEFKNCEVFDLERKTLGYDIGPGAGSTEK